MTPKEEGNYASDLSPLEMFCSYAHEDEPLRRQLEQHLSLLSRQGIATIWHDRQITPGMNWSQAIDTHLETASVIVLLISSAFLSSDYCYGIEMQRALQRHEANEALVIPILLRSCDWQSAPFAELQVLPTGAKAITLWDDRDAAWTNVVTGIRQALAKRSPSAVVPRSSRPRVWNIPYPRNPFFTGRTELLTQLATALHAGHPTALSQPQAVSGLGGIGKTQIALEYAYRYEQDYQAVLWAQADTRENLTSSFLALANLLNLSEKEASESAQVVEAVKRWLQITPGYLLILDNADDLALAREFLPLKPSGQVLLTTRAQATGRFAHRLEVDELPTEQGMLFLLHRAGLLAPDATIEQAKEADRVVAKELCEELGGLPLALDQAGAYIEETGCGLARYEQRYRQKRGKVLAERRGEPVNDHPLPVATTWNLSFEQVEQRSPAAADLLRTCAFLAPDAIPETILTKGASHLGSKLAEVQTDLDVLDQAMEVLRAYSLVRRESRDETTGLFSVHRLVQAVLKDQMSKEEQRQWAERVVYAVNAARPPIEHRTWQQWETLLTHALVCREWIEQEQFAFSEGALLLQQTGWYLTERARYQEAEPTLKQALAITEQEYGLEHIDTARNASTLAYLYDAQGNYDQAVPLYLRALAIREQVLGPLHPNTATSLNNLAYLYRSQGNYAQAEPLYLRALAIREQVLGPLHPSTAISLNNLAALYDAQGNYPQAEPLFLRALAIYEQVLGPQHPRTQIVQANYTSLLKKMKQSEEPSS